MHESMPWTASDSIMARHAAGKAAAALTRVDCFASPRFQDVLLNVPEYVETQGVWWVRGFLDEHGYNIEDFI